MEKKIGLFKYILILFLAIAPFFLFNDVSHADSGWDTGYSSSSSSSSSSRSSSSRSSSSSSRSSSSSGGSSKDWEDMNIFEKIFVSIWVGFCTLLWAGMLLYALIAVAKAAFLAIKDLIYNTYHSIAGYRQDMDKSKFKEILPNYTMSDLKKELYKRFIDVQDAWMNIDYDRLRTLCTDELYNTYHAQLRILELKKGKNIMKGFNQKEIKILDVKTSDDYITVQLYLRVSFIDYVINTKNNKVTAGLKHKKITNHYEMDFVKAVDPKPVTKCPDCGAKVKLVTSGKCEHCGTVIVVPPKEFVLSKKRNIKTTR